MTALAFPLVGGELTMISDPPKGLIHLRETDENNDVDRFLAVQQITSIEMQSWGDDQAGGAAIVIRTTEVEAVNHGGGLATQSVRYILRFDSKEEAARVLKALFGATKQ